MHIEDNLLIIFASLITIFFILDLGFFNKRAHKISLRAALIQSTFWIATALGFAALIFKYMGGSAGWQFLSAYATEEMLSIDNLFVIMLIFEYFKIEVRFHHKVLFWGILGAIIFRGVFIFLGGYFIHEFHWILYLFGIILVYTGYKLFFGKKKEHIDFEKSKIVTLARRYLPFSKSYHSGKFLLRENGKLHFTILVLIVLVVEATDIIFAIDSIPATFAITQDPFIVFTSNILAVMGLRSLFFLLENILHKFHHLQKGLAFVLIFIGVKMLVGVVGISISSFISFLIIILVFLLSILLSILFPKKI